MKKPSIIRKIALLVLLTVFASLNVLGAVNAAQTASSTKPESSETAMRMQSLKDKYYSLSQADLDLQIAKYTDVPKHWGKNYIAKLSALEIIAGGTNGKFGADDKLLGGQFILMLVRTLGLKPEVPSGTPYYMPFVDIAIKQGILKKGEIADYNKPLTREFAAVLTRRALGLCDTIPTDYFVKGTDYEGKGDKGFFDNVYVGYQKLKMTDWNTITGKNLQSVFDCYRMGLFTGSNNKFNPKGFLTRAEGAVIVVKMIDKSARVESVPSSSESFKFTTQSNSAIYSGSCNENTQYYCNKNYTFYKGYFTLMEIWDTVNTLYKSKSLITQGAYNFEFVEKNKDFTLSWYENADIEYQARFNNPNGLILPLNGVVINTHKTAIPKGQDHSIYSPINGYLYNISSSDVKNYDTVIKPISYELMKVWFGADYQKAKDLHDKYLNLALNNKTAEKQFYMINGRQVYFAGGHDIGGNGFIMYVWVKGVISEKDIPKY